MGLMLSEGFLSPVQNLGTRENVNGCYLRTFLGKENIPCI